MIGLAQGALDATMPYLIQRSQFGSPIADFQVRSWMNGAKDLFNSRGCNLHMLKLLQVCY